MPGGLQPTACPPRLLSMVEAAVVVEAAGEEEMVVVALVRPHGVF